MFGLVFWFGIFASVPVFLAAVFVYPKVKHYFSAYINALLFALLSFTAYALCAVLYLGLVALLSAKPDDMSFVFVFIVAGIYFLIRRKLPNPKRLELFLVPPAVISAVLIFYWIRCAVMFGLNGSAGWVSYMMFDAIPFGAAFSELQMFDGWGWLHISSALFPFLSAFLGAGIADMLSERKSAEAEKEIKF